MTALHHPRLRPVAATVPPACLLAEWVFPAAGPVTLLLAGLATAAVAAASGAQRVVTAAPAVLLAAAGIALALSGVATARTLDAALVAAFSVLGSIAVFLIGTGASVPTSVRVLFASAGALALVGYFGTVGGDATRPQPLVIYPVLAAVCGLGWIRCRERV